MYSTSKFRKKKGPDPHMDKPLWAPRYRRTCKNPRRNVGASPPYLGTAIHTAIKYYTRTTSTSTYYTKFSPYFCILYLYFRILCSTRTKAVLSGSKSCSIKGRCALAHWTDTRTAIVYTGSHDREGTPHRAPRDYL
jgi:hypothetical protein